VPRERNGFELSNGQIAEEFAKDLMGSGSPMGFYKSAHGLFRRLLERSREMLKEGSDNLALIGILPRRRILEEFEESFTDEGELAQSIDNDKAREGD